MTFEVPEAREFVAADVGDAFVTDVLSKLEAFAGSVRAAEAEAARAERRLASIAEDDAISTASIATMQQAADDLVESARRDGDERIEAARRGAAASLALASAAAAEIRAHVAPPVVAPPTAVAAIVVSPAVAAPVHVARTVVPPTPPAAIVEEFDEPERRGFHITGALLPAIALVIVLIIVVAWIG